MFLIKYIDNNLVWNKDNEVFAYYELIPYNYSFLSPEQKYLVHDSLYDEYGNIYIAVDTELKGRIRTALMEMILKFEVEVV